ncbi:MAG: exopolysaccharide biosynthesis polyprenyl glycosylphosphotransferase [Verrucomicrobiota bacterium]|nr:exopolysaccharide biosynthesis polyprenyl glycosylphosphotransferase [Verrucomicrobiota bacterium]
MFQGKRIGALGLLQFGADYFAIVVAYFTTLLVRFHGEWGVRFFSVLNRWLGVRETGALPETHEDFYIGSAPRITAIMAVTICALYGLRDLYPGRRFITRRPVAWNVIVANLLALAIFYAYFYLSRNVFHPRGFFATALFLNVIFCLLFRAGLDRTLRRWRSNRQFDRCRAILLGHGKEAGHLSALLAEFHPHGIEVVAEEAWNPGSSFENWIAALEERCRREDIRMIIAAQKDFSTAQIMELLEAADRLDAPAKVLSDAMNILVNRARIPTDTILGTPLVHFEAPSAVRWFRPIRNVASVLAAVAALLVLSPVLAVIALLIKRTSSGPALFAQERIGVNRQPFRMFKFRTMRHRADEMQAQVEEFNESGAGLFKIREDPRVTKVGRFLRRFSLDELPQLFNVARGEMTLVGPRPLPRRDFENYYEDWHYSRHDGMPGLTCLWQVSGRSDIDFHNMCILDVYYLRNKNWALDLKIILRTVRAVLFARGAY